jgi:hypothetical protein
MILVINRPNILGSGKSLKLILFIKDLFIYFLTFQLSYVELSSNERTEFKARELKSVHVDAEGTFLKFVVHKNFVNKLNTYNQVQIFYKRAIFWAANRYPWIIINLKKNRF